jgi:hypothetical protein
MIDKWGRRKFLITGSILMSICLSIITACTAQHAGKPVVSGVGIAFLYIFLISFAACWVSYSFTDIFIPYKLLMKLSHRSQTKPYTHQKFWLSTLAEKASPSTT